MNILSSPGKPDVILDSGAVKFHPISDRAFPLSTWRAEGQSVALLKHVAGAVEQGALMAIVTYRDS